MITQHTKKGLWRLTSPQNLQYFDCSKMHSRDQKCSIPISNISVDILKVFLLYYR